MWKINTLFWGTSGICVYPPRRCAPRWINHIPPRCLKITYTCCSVLKKPCNTGCIQILANTIICIILLLTSISMSVLLILLLGFEFSKLEYIYTHEIRIYIYARLGSISSESCKNIVFQCMVSRFFGTLYSISI
jgi:hypothetical protein